ncbi:NAD(P)-binding protein [Cadophora sp. DSE1049]|nr:NAD(P)-binding protein [Cadophora sp. DSE1049]
MKFDFNPETLPDLRGRVYHITGGNNGIEIYSVYHLAKHNARVYLCARSKEKASSAIAELRRWANRDDLDIQFLQLDLLDLSSVKAAAKEFLSKESQLHGLLNNGGIMAVPDALSKDGFESQFATNYLSHWLLTYLFTPVLLQTAAKLPPSSVRIVNVASSNHTKAPAGGIDFEDINMRDPKYDPWVKYGQSKLANILHAKALNGRYKDKGIWTASLHPGIVDTCGGFPSYLRSLSCFFLRAVGFLIKADEGSWTHLFALASDKFIADLSGAYLEPLVKTGNTSPDGERRDLAEKLWNWTEETMRGKGFI